MNIRIEPITVRDNLAILDPLMEGLHDSERSMNPRTALWADIGESYMRYIMQMQEEEVGTCLIAFVDEVPAGFIFGFVEDADDDSNYETYRGLDLYVSDGYVRPEFRRMGLYRMMNAMLEKLFKEKGVGRIQRFTLVANKPMQAFLEDVGYKPVRVLYAKWLGD